MSAYKISSDQQIIWSLFPGAVTLIVLLPEHTAAVDEHANTEPAACGTLGQLPLVVAVPLTNMATALAGMLWLPVFLRFTAVPAALSILIFCACWLSCC